DRRARRRGAEAERVHGLGESSAARNERATGVEHALTAVQVGRLERERGRPAVAEPGGRADPFLARVAGIRSRVDLAAEERRRRAGVEVVERLRQTEREARPLDERTVRAEGRRVITRQTDRDVRPYGAVGRLVAGVSRDVTARTPHEVVRR